MSARPSPRIRPVPIPLTLAMLTLAALALAASPDRQPVSGAHPAVRHGGPLVPAKAAVDTVQLLGGPGRWDGRFELPGQVPFWHGWTHRDLTFDPEAHWEISDVDPLVGLYSMWCGTQFPDGPGYGNSWDQSLRFRRAVAAPGPEVTVRWTGQMRTDTEPGYDYVYLQVNRGGVWQTLQQYDGAQTVTIDETVVLTAGELVGDAGDEVQLRVRFTSDGAWSDEDGLWPTEGACWLDELTVSVDGEPVSHEDFEDQDPGPWEPVLAQGVGDFAALWHDLQDLDFCRSNSSWQVAFIDDGQVVPGTGGTPCITWCYGPGGYIVNNTGGLLGESSHLHNRVESPVLDWPAGCDGAQLAFDVYRHEVLSSESPGIYYTWGVRSTADPVNEPIEQQTYVDRSFVYYGGPEYLRHVHTVGDLLEPGRVQVQMCLEVMEIGWIWGFWGYDGTPAPYFDNVSLRAYPYGGPQIAARLIDLPNDGFPAQGFLDLENPASNSVRFDMAQSIAQDQPVNDPGDSLVVNVAVLRDGAELIRPPRMLVRMRANPLFDAVRTLPPNFTRTGAMISGWVAGDTVRAPGGHVVPDRWAFDLPDTGFFYPGDVIRTVFEAGDVLAADDRWSVLPADTTGFSDFAGGIRWDPDFTVRALPTVTSEAGAHPELLIWDDAGRDHDAAARWWLALANLGYLPGRDYDLFTTRSPSSAVGNSLAGRCTADLLDGYPAVLYTAGEQLFGLLSNGDGTDEPTDDLGLIHGWLDAGDRALCMLGDNLYSSVRDAGAGGAVLVEEVLGAEVVAVQVTSLIGNQTAPLVRRIQGGWAPAYAEEWVAYGGCPTVNRFDAVTARAGALRTAEFTDPAGNGGVYPYAAMIQRTDAANGNVAFSLPYDLLFVQSPPGYAGDTPYGPVPVRVVLLGDILQAMGTDPSGPPVAAPDAPPALALRQYPNPFNPRTTIALDLPRAAAVALRIYDVRGTLVRTLVDERLPAGHHDLVWDGADGRGRPAASGVYFAEVRALGERRLQKMTLVR